MLRIDSHQHFWKFDKIRDSWITDDMKVLQKDFLPEHLAPLLQQYHFDGCVVVQSDQSLTENAFHLQNSKDNPFVKGIVGWVDLQAEGIEEQLREWSKQDKIKGFRHVLQGEADRAMMLKPAFVNGISKLKQFDFTYDILIFQDQLDYATDFAAKFPDQPFVLDHIAKPDIKNGRIEDWKIAIQKLAKHKNVYCKVSGMITEANWKQWKTEDFRPYLDVVFEAFGVNRVMYGSDWPVCLVAGTYGEVVHLMEDYIAEFSQNEQQQFWGANATRFYNLK